MQLNIWKMWHEFNFASRSRVYSFIVTIGYNWNKVVDDLYTFLPDVFRLYFVIFRGVLCKLLESNYNFTLVYTWLQIVTAVASFFSQYV
jgi:hypothetical protein